MEGSERQRYRFLYSVSKYRPVNRGVKFPDVFGPARDHSMRNMRESVTDTTGPATIAIGPRATSIKSIHILVGFSIN